MSQNQTPAEIVFYLPDLLHALEAATFNDKNLAVFKQILNRCKIRQSSLSVYDSWSMQNLQAKLADLPWASWLAQSLGLKQQSHWAILEASEFKPDQHGIYCLGNNHLLLSQAEKDLVQQALEQSLSSHGLKLHDVAGNKWLLESQQVFDLALPPLFQAIGKEITQLFLADNANMLWQARLTEWQMAIHQGADPIAGFNGFWLWGNQTQQSEQSCSPTCYMASQHLPLPPAGIKISLDESIDKYWQASIDTEKNINHQYMSLLFESIFDQPYQTAESMQNNLSHWLINWFAPCLAKLKAGKIKKLTLYVDDEHHYVMNRWDLVKFWQNNQTFKKQKQK